MPCCWAICSELLTRVHTLVVGCHARRTCVDCSSCSWACRYRAFLSCHRASTLPPANPDALSVQSCATWYVCGVEHTQIGQRLFAGVLGSRSPGPEQQCVGWVRCQRVLHSGFMRDHCACCPCRLACTQEALDTIGASSSPRQLGDGYASPD